VEESRQRFCQARSMAEGWRAPGVGGWAVHVAQGTRGVTVFVSHGRHGGRVRYKVGGRRGPQGGVFHPHVVGPAVVVRVVGVGPQLAERVRGQHVGWGMVRCRSEMTMY
jgi:hypothetical protein